MIITSPRPKLVQVEVALVWMYTHFQTRSCQSHCILCTKPLSCFSLSLPHAAAAVIPSKKMKTMKAKHDHPQVLSLFSSSPISGSRQQQRCNPKKNFLTPRSWWFRGRNGSVGEFGKYHLNQIDTMEQSRPFNGQGNVGDTKEHKGCVDKIQHAMSGIDLSRQLSHCDCDQNQRHTRL